MTEDAYLEWRRQIQANRPSWTLINVLRCWLAWRREWASGPIANVEGESIPFERYVGYWSGLESERRISE